MWAPPNYPGHVSDPAHVAAVLKASRNCIIQPMTEVPSLPKTESRAASSSIRYVDGPSKRTTSPVVQGSSVLAIKYADGVMIAADTLGSYGSLAMFPDFERIRSVSPTTLVAAGGDLSDFQQIMKLLGEKAIVDICHDDGKSSSPREYWSYLTRVMYHRRIKGDPLWNQVVMAGFTDAPFLGFVDLRGTSYEEDIIATGYGQYIAIPLLRNGWRPDLSEADARSLLLESMRVLQYRECLTINSIQLAKITKDGPVIEPAQKLSLNWDCAANVTH